MHSIYDKFSKYDNENLFSISMFHNFSQMVKFVFTRFCGLLHDLVTSFKKKFQVHPIKDD